MPAIKSVLVLGTGLGSLMQVVHGKGYAPKFTLVEKDKTVLGWALELLDKKHVAQTEPICIDALAFMEQNRRQYDLVFIDVFMGMVVPDFVTTLQFLQLCKDSMAPGGHLAFNYIVNHKHDWERVKELFGTIFPGYHVLDRGINRILIATQKA